MKKPVALIIMDGFGHTTQKEGSAIDKANTDNLKRLFNVINKIHIKFKFANQKFLVGYFF